MLFGGKRVSGNGKISSREISSGNFENVEAAGGVTVYLRQAPAGAVKVQTDENLFEFLNIRTEGNTLYIEPKEHYNLRPSKDIIVYASAPQLKTLSASGASKLIGEGEFTGEKIRIDASGASEVSMAVNLSKIESDLSGASTLNLKGNVDQFMVEGSGASKIMCMDLEAEKANLDVSGASEARVTANKELVIEASGASDVEYRGNANINQKSSGASSVKKVS